MAIGVVQPWMGGINDQITFAAIPAEFQNQVVVKGAIDPGKVKTSAARAADDRHRGPEGRGEMVVPLCLDLAGDPDRHLRRHRAV